MATKIVTVQEAEGHLLELIGLAEQGEEVVIAKAGRPVARLVPLPPRVPRRTPGSARGLVEIGPEFDAPLPDEVRRGFE